MCKHRHPIQCVVPPHMLQNIAENGSDEQRAWAIGTLYQSEQFRGQRLATQDFSILGVQAAMVGGLRRTVYNARYGTDLPGVVVRQEGDPPTGDEAIDEAYDGAGVTYNLYKEIYNRDSFDGNGLPILSTVHYGQGYDNAFWNGKQMVYGDGDEDLPPNMRLFNRFTKSIDIIGHELTHAVTQYESQLVYLDQAGALNEALSDIFGIMVKQRLLNQTADQSDWIIGAELFTANVNGVGIRSMKAPGTAYNDPVLGQDPQPGHMDDYKDVTYDNGGVHINSGIPNRAFYVTALELGGFAWEKAGRIWYKAQTEKFGSRIDFQTAADDTYEAAGDLYGKGSLEQKAVQTGWQAVGINVTVEPPPPPPPPPPVDPPEPQGCWKMLLDFLGGPER